MPYSFYVNGGSSSPSFNYFVLSGTSMATGVVSGAVADLLQKTPSLTPDQVKARLMKTAYKTFPQYSSVTDPTTGITYTDQYDIFTVGAGYIDLQAALQNTNVASGTAMSPSATYNSGYVYLSDDPSSVWNTSSTWANSAIWGSTEFATGAPTMNGSNALWGANAVWGSNALWGANGLWGSNALWGANALWGSNALWGANFAAGEQ